MLETAEPDRSATLQDIETWSSVLITFTYIREELQKVSFLNPFSKSDMEKLIIFIVVFFFLLSCNNDKGYPNCNEVNHIPDEIIEDEARSEFARAKLALLKSNIMLGEKVQAGLPGSQADRNPRSRFPSAIPDRSDRIPACGPCNCG